MMRLMLSHVPIASSAGFPFFSVMMVVGVVCGAVGFALATPCGWPARRRRVSIPGALHRAGGLLIGSALVTHLLWHWT